MLGRVAPVTPYQRPSIVVCSLVPRANRV